jgi:hypothetical protein
VTSTKERRRNPKPRSWIAGTAARRSFGKDLHVPWVPDNGDTSKRVQIQAAKAQNEIAVYVQESAAERHSKGEKGWTLREVAERLQTVDYHGLMRVLRGDVQMSLLHIADLSNEFGRIYDLNQEVKRWRGLNARRPGAGSSPTVGVRRQNA